MLNAIKYRRSCRIFSPKKIEESILIEILKAAQFAPTGKNSRAWEFIIISDNEMKLRISPMLNQKFLLDAPIFLIPIIYTNKSLFPIEDISIASDHIMLQAKENGLDSVWIHVSEWGEKELKSYLRIPEQYLLINLLMIGYCRYDLPPHTDGEFDVNKIHINAFNPH